MAKKKQTRSRKKSSPSISVERSPFWGYFGAILLMLAGLCVLLGGFNTGGPLPTGLFGFARNLLGMAAYLVPLALVFYGVVKFGHERRKIPFVKGASMVGLLLFSAAWLHVTFGMTTPSLGNPRVSRGGSIGDALGGLVLGALDMVPASILFFILVLLMIFVAFGISLSVLAKPFRAFKEWREDRANRDDSETDLASLKDKAGTGFKLNAGVPVEGRSPEPEDDKEPDAPKPRLTSMRNASKPLAVNENHEALTIASDPNWRFPSANILIQKQDKADAGNVEGNAAIIKETLNNFNINVEVEGANVGPRVTQFMLRPDSGVKLTKITALENNLALDLAVTSIRIEAPIPGKRAVGIELPNIKSATVRMSSVLGSQQWREQQSPLSIAIGKDISGMAVVGDLAKMPHLLVAGQTGSGKSVMINTILTGLLYRNSPSDLKLILVDPKQVELAPYDGIPHLLTPVITEPEKCISALKWAVAEMERRYKALADDKRRNIAEYNSNNSEETMPYIVIVIDELADLMMMAARDVEALVVRIAQKARAVGIHLILATQRPSVDVITGLIKANVPARISFTTASQIDSRTIIDQMGAEKLLGQGDMLMKTNEIPKPRRVQGAFITDEETNKLTEFLRSQRLPDYNDEVVSQPVQLNGKGGIVADNSGGNDADDDMWQDAVRVVIEAKKASTSLLQRRLRIGYGRAARIIETMEEQGIIGGADGSRPRDVLVSSMDDVFGGPAVGDGDDDYDEPPQPPSDKFLVQ